MKRTAPRWISAATAIAVTFAALVSCGDPTGVSPSPSGEAAAPFLFGSGPKLVACPTNLTEATTGTISPLGGSLEVAGTSVLFPAGALLQETEFTVTVPAGQYVEVRIEATGFGHFEFLEPIVVRIDYSRCSRSNILRAPLQVWYIDEASKALLERQLVLLDNKLTSTITFTTPHLSTYAVAE